MQPSWDLFNERWMRFYLLPTYRPALNRIESLWKKMECEWLPFRSYTANGPEQATDAIGIGFSAEYQLTFC